MAHISNLTAGIYTSLCYNSTAGALSTMDTSAELVALFATAPVEIQKIREFPEFGNPANIVNVPVYGQPVTSQVSGQADQNTMEFTINYIPSDLAALQALVQNGLVYAFQIALASARPANFQQVATTGIATGSVANTVFNFAGKFEAITVVPSLTDALTCKLTISMQTPLFGPATYA